MSAEPETAAWTAPATHEVIDADVLVVGGGIAGIQSSLDLADAGARVVLVEKEPAIGGKMAALDKNFPTLDCSICIEAPKLSEVIQHDNIEVLTLATLEGLDGEVGQFTARVHQRPRFVSDECTRCDDCVQACPQVTENEFDEGMASRKAIYTPYEQAEPGAYVLDMDTCLNTPPNNMPCDRCVRACVPDCIDFDLTATEYAVNVSTVIASTGFDLLNPQVVEEYGYGDHPDVLTSLEYERLLDAAGPTEGHILRPSTGEAPDNVLFVLCVGSRDQRHCDYCSRVCCMYSTKQAIQTMGHGVPDVTTLYMDIRAYGKGFDAFYERARDEGAEYRRGRPAAVDTSGPSPVVRFEDTERGELVEEAFDLVVLAPAIIPSDGTEALAAVLGVELDDDGFLVSTEADGDMIGTTRPGVYAAGCATGPKDIPDSVAEASGAAAKALEHVRERTWPEPIDVPPIDPSGEERVGVVVCDCGTNIADTVDVPAVVEWAAELPDVVYAEEVMFACAGNTQDHLTEMVIEHSLNRLVVASCSPKTHGPTFEGVVARAGLNEYLLEMANIRNHDSWVHDDREAATAKAKDMVKMAVDKAAFLTPLERITQPITQRALVVGGGIAGMTAAISLAQQGNETHLVEREAELGGVLRDLHTLHPGGRDAQALLEARLAELDAAGVHVHAGAEVENVSGFIGNFAVDLSTDETLDVGAIVLATGADLADAPEAFDGVASPEVVTNLELEGRLAAGEVDAETVTFLGCVGSRDGEQGCSRYCCQSMVGQAAQLAAEGVRVNVVAKDVRTFTRAAEEAYRDAAADGVRFFRYDAEATPEEAITIADGEVVFEDRTLGETVALPSDLVVMAMGLRATDAGVEGNVAQQLKVSRDEAGFLLERHPKLGPTEASVGGVFMAGSAQSPKDVRDATDQALGAAAKAGGLLAKDTVEQEPLVAQIDAEACTGCTRCAIVCPYNAIEGSVQEVHEVIEAACMGCGTCAAECPVDAITMPGFTDEQIRAQIDAALETNPEEKVITFACNWCSYAGADQAGIEKRTYPPSARIIRTMCSGRVDADFVDYAFERGAGAVLLSGCHIGDCHYIDANTYAQKRYERKRAKLERDEGFDEERLQLEWISAAEGRKFAEKMTEMDDIVNRYLASGGAAEAVADGGSSGEPRTDGGEPHGGDGGCSSDCTCGSKAGDGRLDDASDRPTDAGAGHDWPNDAAAGGDGA